MGRLHGIPIILYNKIQTGVDGFNRPVYEEEPEVIENVLVGQPTAQEVTDALNLTGKQAIFALGIPKGDAHVWTDRTVEFFGEKFRTFSRPTQGIEDLVPLDWHKTIMVEKYE